jgi:hypothetical protein
MPKFEYEPLVFLQNQKPQMKKKTEGIMMVCRNNRGGTKRSKRRKG